MITDLEVGKYDKRLESAITTPMDKAIDEVARALAGGARGNFRSKAARKLIAMGYAAYQKEQAKRREPVAAAAE